MTQQRATALTTILFTDLVASTELLQRAGDEDAQRIFKAHHKLLRDAVTASGGHEVKWLGDGLMVAFPSAADAVRCAITMQRASRRPAAGGERLEIRVGLHAGEALIDESDYFGTTVVIARRLCDSAAAGQVLCSGLVSGLLAGRQAFAFRDIGALALKGITAPVQAAEVLYERDDPAAFLSSTPFVGRGAEVAKLTQKLRDADNGRGGLVMLVGEPGIGKTRTSQEFADAAVALGARVLQGRCFEGDWSPPYGAFADAIETYARETEPDELRADLGYGAPPIARLVPALRERLPDVDEPAPLQPDEERFRLMDAVSQFLIATSRRAPVLLMLDDLHWADRGTIAMMRHVARFAPQHRMLILGNYRDVELDRQHPLSDALAALRREVEYERIVLKGLAPDEVGTLLATIAEQEVNPALIQAISDETDGNPFFIREVLIHLVQEGKLYREDGEWRSKAQSIADLGIPEGVRQVITRRLSRLSPDANKLMSAASAFNGGFRFETISAVSGLDEGVTLDAIDEALDAQLLRPDGRADHYDFTHALIRHTLYGEMNPSRQVRLHRRIAEAMSERADPAEGGDLHAGELAYQYHRSAAIPGAERGVPSALQAADEAEAAGAWDESVTYLRMALELALEDDAPRIRGRLAIALAWSLQPDDALKEGRRAGEELVRVSPDAAPKFYADLTEALFGSGNLEGAWTISPIGLEVIGGMRDASWVRLTITDISRREANDPEFLGIPVESPDRAELASVIDELVRSHPGDPQFAALKSRNMGVDWAGDRADVMRVDWRALVEDERFGHLAGRLFIAGDARVGAEMALEIAQAAERSGSVAPAVADWAYAARANITLGEFELAGGQLQRSRDLAGRLTTAGVFTLQLVAAEDEWRVAMREISPEVFSSFSTLALQPTATDAWARAAILTGVARTAAYAGDEQMPIPLIAQAVPTLEKAPASAPNYVRAVCTAVEALWLLRRTDHAEALERSIREKVLPPDFRYITVDPRLSLAHICALTGRHDEASEWFAAARAVLDEEGWRPLRAIVDHDEALMYARRGADGDAARARPLLEAALTQFRDIGMTGWQRHAEELQAQLL